ncbi:cell envelope integrity protein TolA [Alicycliphilus denitrificans]|uniref:cell envelope integrity protein TolA n=1 Tax=Alicycliphilus denitrificans TaxID=179636 RepID=UPI003A80B6CD
MRNARTWPQRTQVWLCISMMLLLASTAQAQPTGGTYTGTLECGPLITNPQQGPWSQPVQLTISGQSVAWERLDSRLSESGSGMLLNGRVSFNLEGRWNPGQRSTGQWRNVVMLEWKDSALSGPATIFSANGDQRLRDCSVRVAMAGGAKSVAVPPPVSASPAAAERARREQEANREKDALRERAIRENDERIARQREAQRRSQEAWEQQQQAVERQREAERKAKEEQERQRQVAAKQQQEREAQERAAAKTQQEANAKGAATRQAARIRALGLPADFTSSMLYVSYGAAWTELMPCAQWLGLLLENQKISEVRAISVRGRPGVSIKRPGQPAIGFVFRTESKEAYVWALVTDDRASLLETPGEHMHVAQLLALYTDPTRMP